MAIADGMQIVIPAPGGARDKRFIENYWKFIEKFPHLNSLGRADHAGAAQPAADRRRRPDFRFAPTR